MIYFEIFFLIVIIGLQFYFFTRSKIEIDSIRVFFPKSALTSESLKVVDYEGNVIEQIEIKHHSKEFNKVVNATNSYLLKNKGSADFNIIKNIADRSVEAQENKVSSMISLPLYFGLMGTFIGVILGLGSIAFKGFDLKTTDSIITELISGVVLAMLVSLFGLALTTLLNAFLFKSATAERDINRNIYLNFLQVELLPNLDNNLYSALDRFKSSISEFNDKFNKNLDLFDSSFNENIKYLKDTVVGMATQIQSVNQNTALQTKFLQKLQDIGYNRMAEANIRVFDKIKESGPILVGFIKEQQKLTENIEQANLFVEKISAILDRVNSFEASISSLGREIQQSDLLGADMLSLVKKHLEAIGEKQGIVLDYASRSTYEVENYLSRGLEQIKTLSRKIEVDFEQAMNFEAGGNLMQNLKHLKLIDENTAKLNIHFKERNDIGIENRLDTLNTSIRELIYKSENKNVINPKSRKSTSETVVPVRKKWYKLFKIKE